MRACSRPTPSDPAARWTGAHGGQAFFACSTNYVVDVENAVIRRCRGDHGDLEGVSGSYRVSQAHAPCPRTSSSRRFPAKLLAFLNL